MTASNDKQFEQQKSDTQKASLQNQVEDNYDENSQAAAERIAENAEDAKSSK